MQFILRLQLRPSKKLAAAYLAFVRLGLHRLGLVRLCALWCAPLVTALNLKSQDVENAIFRISCVEFSGKVIRSIIKYFCLFQWERESFEEKTRYRRSVI